MSRVESSEHLSLPWTPLSRAEQFSNFPRDLGSQNSLASHAIDHGAALPVVQATLEHGGISVTSGYLHARPDSSSGLHLDPGVFLR